jgi:hypothetical protein
MSEEHEKSRTQIFYEWLSKNQIGFSFTIEDVLPVFKMARPSMLMVLDRFVSVGVLRMDGPKYKFSKLYTGRFMKAKKLQIKSPVANMVLNANYPKEHTNLPAVIEVPKKSPLDELIEYVHSLEDEVKQLRALLVKKYS